MLLDNDASRVQVGSLWSPACALLRRARIRGTGSVIVYFPID